MKRCIQLPCVYITTLSASIGAETHPTVVHAAERTNQAASTPHYAQGVPRCWTASARRCSSKSTTWSPPAQCCMTTVRECVGWGRGYAHMGVHTPNMLEATVQLCSCFPSTKNSQPSCYAHCSHTLCDLNSSQALTHSVISILPAGNVSSSSTWYTLGFIESVRGVKKGDQVLQVGVGSGIKCGLNVWKVRSFEDV